MKLKNKILIIYIILSFMINITITSFATNTTENSQENLKKDNSELNLYSKSCILIERSTNRVAYEKNAYEKMYPASTTKLLTAILAIENCNLTDKVTITNEMVSKIPSGYTIANLQVGETLTVEQLLNTLLIPSANDSGYALAIHISGSIENFSKLMNEKASQIGCTNSNFTNPSGIHNVNHYSTSKDMALIALYALKYPVIAEIGNTKLYSLPNIKGLTRNFETTNTLLKKEEKYFYEFATGLKTGFTQPAGSCIVATAKKDNMEFLVVVLGAPEATNEYNYRDMDCKTLFEYGFTNYENIIKLDNHFFNFFKNIIISENLIKTVFKISSIFTILFFAYTILNKKKLNNKSKKKFSDKENTNLDEFNFRCSFW